MVSPFDLSQTLPVGGGLLVLYSLSGSPVIKQLMQMVTMVPGQGGQFQSVCFPWPGTIVTICMSCFMTGDPGKEYGTNKPPPT